MNLYPLKFKTIFKEKIWGGNKIKTVLNKDFAPLENCGETWELSAVQGELSIVENGFLAGNNIQELIEIYMGDLIGDKIYEKFGIEFPLLIKFIDANDDLSIQVHPDDKLAEKRHKAYGKTEMWYILQAEKNAEITIGFKNDITEDIYLEHLRNNTLTDILNIEKSNKGDVFYIPAGRVHAIGKGNLLCEIQQTSDITYRIFDWNRKDKNGETRELHTKLAVEAIDYNTYDNYKIKYDKKQNSSNNIITCNYFTTNFIPLNAKITKDYYDIDSFVIYICIDGNFKLKYNDTDNITINKGDVYLIPAEIKSLELTPLQDAKILEVYI